MSNMRDMVDQRSSFTRVVPMWWRRPGRLPWN